MTPFRFLPKILRILLVANAIVFGVAFLLGSMLGLHLNVPGAGYGNIRDYIVYFGAFFPTSPFEAWRYVTYMFVHVDFAHFFFNMLMLWMFGAEVAEWMGVKHFTIMYFFCGIFAAIFSVVMCVLGLTNNPIIGASGALMGIFVAYYKFFPERHLLMFFVIPMKIKYAMWVMIALDVMFAGSGDAIAHFAHLGGVVAGFIYMALYQNVFTKSSVSWKNVWKNARRESPRDAQDDKSGAIEGEVFYVDEQKRMNEILNKVNREGIQALSESERQFLLEAGEKLRRRRGGM